MPTVPKVFIFKAFPPLHCRLTIAQARAHHSQEQEQWAQVTRTERPLRNRPHPSTMIHAGEVQRFPLLDPNLVFRLLARQQQLPNQWCLLFSTRRCSMKDKHSNSVLF